MFCQNCGAEVSGAFCQKCGAAAPGSAPGGGAPAQGGAQAAGLTDNAAGALCYLAGLVTGILFLVIAPYNAKPAIRFHAWQSILFNIGLIVFFILESIVFSFLPGVLFFIIAPVQALLSLGIFLFWLFLMWKTYSGDTISIPVIGDLARKQAGAQ